MTEQERKARKKEYSKEYNREWHERNAEKVRERVKAWAKENRERANETKRKSYRKYPERHRNRRLIRLYGITLEEFDQMCTSQNAACAICGNKSKLVPDHDHETGKVREALCYKCNIILGQANDNIEVLKTAIRYLEKHSLTNNSISDTNSQHT